MEADTLHDLTAAYALDALDPEDAREYEAHLARCERCRGELASLSEACYGWFDRSPFTGGEDTIWLARRSS